VFLSKRTADPYGMTNEKSEAVGKTVHRHALAISALGLLAVGESEAGFAFEASAGCKLPVRIA